jgi:DNA-directed RNA polymerase subunit RPC12/RpoP
VTITLRCLGCGFSFTVTHLKSDPEAHARPIACGHCRSTRWSSKIS